MGEFFKGLGYDEKYEYLEESPITFYLRSNDFNATIAALAIDATEKKRIAPTFGRYLQFYDIPAPTTRVSSASVSTTTELVGPSIFLGHHTV